jgi:hypothetical protein
MLLAALVLLGFVLVLVANRRIAPRNVVSYPEPPLGSAREVVWSPTPDGGLPPGATAADGVWDVQMDADTGLTAICQSAGGPTGLMPVDFLLMDKRFPLLAMGDFTADDLVIQAQFKLVSGNVDRAAGIAFRMRNQDNYYVVRVNGLEANANLYRFVAGQRSLIHEARLDVPSGVWRRLDVEAHGPRIRWSVDGRAIGEAEDGTHRSGGVGLWTKADSVSCFADVRARRL